jgi:hypothetical protein
MRIAFILVSFELEKTYCREYFVKHYMSILSNIYFGECDRLLANFIAPLSSWYDVRQCEPIVLNIQQFVVKMDPTLKFHRHIL